VTVGLKPPTARNSIEIRGEKKKEEEEKKSEDKEEGARGRRREMSPSNHPIQHLSGRRNAHRGTEQM
jgi:hypothetical protein